MVVNLNLILIGSRNKDEAGPRIRILVNTLQDEGLAKRVGKPVTPQHRAKNCEPE